MQFVAEVAAEEERGDFDGAAGCAIEKRLLGCVAEGGDELGEEVCDAAWRKKYCQLSGVSLWQRSAAHHLVCQRSRHML